MLVLIAPLPEIPVAVIITTPVGSVVDNLMASAPAPADSTVTEGAATDTLPPSTVTQGLTLLHYLALRERFCGIERDASGCVRRHQAFALAPVLSVGYVGLLWRVQ